MANQKRTKAAPKNSGKSTSQAADVMPDENSLDKVRDLLFGTAIRESNDNLHTIEKRFEQKLEKLDKDIHAKLKTISEQLQKTNKELTKAVASENNQRQKSVDDLLTKVESSNQSIADLDTQLMLEHKEMIKQFDSDLEQLKQKFDKLHKEAMTHLNTSAKTLGDTKTDREFLANLLNDLSSRLQKGK